MDCLRPEANASSFYSLHHICCPLLLFNEKRRIAEGRERRKAALTVIKHRGISAFGEIWLILSSLKLTPLSGVVADA